MQVTNAPPPPKTYAASEVSNDSGVTGTNVDDALDTLDTALDTKLNTSSYTAADVLSKLLTVDGSGSSLDADTVDGQHAAAFQPVDSDLTAIAALSPSNDDIIQRKAGAWTNRTIAQLLTDATEGIQDLVGAMVSGGTETNISVTYNDTTGKLDFAVPDASASAAGVIELAVQSEMETATDTTRAVVPGRVHNHPGVAKFWACITVSGGTPTLAASYNVTSITDTGTGQVTVTIATDFSSANWSPQVTVRQSGFIPTVYVESQAAGSITATCINISTLGTGDPAAWSIDGNGDQ